MRVYSLSFSPRAVKTNGVRFVNTPWRKPGDETKFAQSPALGVKWQSHFTSNDTPSRKGVGRSFYLHFKLYYTLLIA